MLDGEVVILAGATGRVGGATLRRLHEVGAEIVVVSRSQDHAERACRGYERALPGMCPDVVLRAAVLDADD